MRARRGSALILVLLMTLAVAGLAIAAIFMSSSAGLLSRFYDREREFRLATESAIEMAQTRLMRDTALAIPDTGMRQLYAGLSVTDADGGTVPRVLVNVFAAQTGDTSGYFLPHVTLIAVAYDANGTRHVRRTDLRRESFSRYQLFADSFPASATHGPATVNGRAHTNQTWRSTGSGNVYRDTMSAVTAFSGTATFDVDSLVGVRPVPYPSDSTYPRLTTMATTASLAFTPITGSARGTRLEFVAIDTDDDGVVEAHEGFVKVFDLSTDAAIDTTRLRASPVTRTGCTSLFCGTSYTYYDWDDPIVQNQCGAFYFRNSRWHFFPISSHRSTYAKNVIQATGGSNYPAVNPAMMNRIDNYDHAAVEEILRDNETARCFPAGSPFLMPSERFTTGAGAVTGNAVTDTFPFGVVTPAGGWPASASTGYGGSDTTFTATVRTCQIPVTSSAAGRCVAGTRRVLGTWRTFGGTLLGTISPVVRQATETPYLWPYSNLKNAASRGVITASAGPLFVSGEVRGRVTLYVGGRVSLVDRVTFERDANDPDLAACENQLGLIARGDVLVAEGLTSRVRRVGDANNVLAWLLDDSETVSTGGATGFTLHGSFMSLTGTVGVENPNTTMGATANALPCPDGAAASTATNGGCLAHTGSAIMRRYTAPYGATANSGHRYFGMPDRCQATTRRPPFFPLTNRYTPVRTLEVEPSQANTPVKIRALLMRLKGKTL